MKHIKNETYVVIPELPEEQQRPFSEWLIGQTLPVIDDEGENRYNCAYKWDYDKWLAYWQKGKNAPVYD